MLFNMRNYLVILVSNFLLKIIVATLLKIKKVFFFNFCFFKTEQDTFSNLPSLEQLSLKKNLIHEIPIFGLSVSVKLQKLHFESFDDDENPFVVPDFAFRDMASLEELSLTSLKLGNLVSVF